MNERSIKNDIDLNTLESNVIKLENHLNLRCEIVESKDHDIMSMVRSFLFILVSSFGAIPADRNRTPKHPLLKRLRQE